MDNSNQLDTQSTEETLPKTPKKKRTFLIIACCIALVATLGASVAFTLAQFTPEKKISRYLSQGDKYLDELDYERALASYQAALEIEPKDLDARLGIIEASYHLDLEDELLDSYDETMSIIASLDEEQLKENDETITEIYEWAPEIYCDDLEKTVAILEEGYALNKDNDDLKDLLIKTYDELANLYYQNANYEQMLEIYKRWDSIDPSNSSLDTKYSDCLRDYLNTLIGDSNTGKVKEIINCHFDVAADIILSPALEAMENKDIEKLTIINDTDLINIFAETLNNTPCVYTVDGPVNDYTGTALGVYPFEEGGCYFYYGNYENGSREGQGTYFVKYNPMICTLFEGTWANDKPNGNGTLIEYNRINETSTYNSHCTRYMTGNFTNGIGNGTFDCVINDSQTGDSFHGSFTAEQGVFTDVYDNYPQYHAYGPFSDTHQAGNIIYVVYTNDTTNKFWYSWSFPDEKFILSGFYQ